MNKIIPFERSFAAHPKSQYWNYERNIGKPSDYALNSHKKFWFDCNKCGHCFDNTLHALNSRNTWCSYCANTNLCNDNNCKICYEKSISCIGEGISDYNNKLTENEKTIIETIISLCY